MAGRFGIICCLVFLFTLLQAQPTYTITHYTTENDLPANGPPGRKFHFDKAHFKDGDSALYFTQLPDKNGYRNYAHCFSAGEYGYCWISTNKGVFKVALNDILIAYGDGVYPCNHYVGQANGTINTKMYGGCCPCAAMFPGSTVSFPVMPGLLKANPATVKPALIWNDIYPDHLFINGTAYDPASLEGAVLPAATNNIIIKLAIRQWRNPENGYMKYRLDNGEWRWIAKDNTVSIINPGSGQHVLEIIKLNGGGQNHQAYKVIRFAIDKHWYATWWFAVLSLASGIGFAYLTVHLRTRQMRSSRKKLEDLLTEQTSELKEQNRRLEKKDAIQTRLISIINHDMITPLKFLSSTSGKLLEKKYDISDEIRDETIGEVARTSKSLQLLASDILNWIKYYNEGIKLRKDLFSLYTLINTVFEVLGPVATQKGIRLINKVDAGTEIYQYHDPMKVLVYNLVMNAINFSEAEPVTVDTQLRNDGIVLRIIDKGQGMPAEQAENLLTDQPGHQVSGATNAKGKGFGLGYMIIRDLIKITKVEASIESQPGAGTSVILFIKKEEPMHYVYA